MKQYKNNADDHEAVHHNVRNLKNARNDHFILYQNFGIQLYVVGVNMIRNFIVEKYVQILPSLAQDLMAKIEKRLVFFRVTQKGKRKRMGR